MDLMLYFNPRTSYEVRPQRYSRPFETTHFNPRTSYEVRQSTLYGVLFEYVFQSTHLLRGATRWGYADMVK